MNHAYALYIWADFYLNQIQISSIIYIQYINAKEFEFDCRALDVQII